tara:strand:+ start:250 stop:411 length:162 start_codon:yes stop_codon:yes gene_type:complete
MITFQMQNIESLLKWLKTCPHKCTISSMQGGFVHVKFFITENEITKDEEKYEQ